MKIYFSDIADQDVAAYKIDKIEMDAVLGKYRPASASEVSSI